MRGLTNGAPGPELDEWEALHQGADREPLDSPARFKLNRSAVLTAVRSLPGVKRAPAPVPAPASPPPPRSMGRRMMRPYAHTRGRTRPDYELALEALVSTSDRGRRYEGAVSVQHRRICDLCVEPRSIAEIAAFLYLPLNVVKVLVSDMDNLELVMIHQPGLSFGDRSSRQFMARVLDGLRGL
ncbi:DUF742 domain-containing protein [Amycolatopsis sp.]|uniref:DUF742 domain-containing protein n=1 Tax=Amycolatopsis sp. TaxID=37632 RepID=UPI002BBA3554|nr:DUF742 domain-containing protein [Amycolatopsis sp.]HVV11549.1 DUF742 domain-containing protein [Amycolatopsis sp.]